MKKLRLLTMLGLSLLVGGTAFAQNRVSGVVTSSEDNQPLAGVVVQQVGTQNGVLTNADGSYTINGADVANGTLAFSYAGMRRQEVAVAGRSTVNVVLQPDAIQASAVTVTALGGRKQERKMGYATSTVEGEDLSRTNAISAVNALQGKVAGLNISTVGSSGLTGSPVITMRGAKSMTKNNSPIFVIDGIVMENQETSLTDLGTQGNKNTMYGNQLKNLNMNDYESVTVLKGAAATSLYGSRGANGAIVITTKGGKARQGLGIEVNYSHEFTSIYAPPIELQNVYGMGEANNGYEGGYRDDYESSWTGYTPSSFGPAMNTGINMRQYYKLDAFADPIEPLVSHEDNWKAYFQTGQQDNVSVALTGGSEKAQFRASYGYADMAGIIPNNGFTRHSVNVRANGQLNDIFSVDLSLQYSNSNTKNAAMIHNESARNNSYALQSTTYLNRSMDLDWYKNNYLDMDTWYRMSTNGVAQLNYIQQSLNAFYDKNEMHNEQTIIASLGLNAQFNDWLDASVRMSYNNYQYFNETKNYGAGYGRGAGEPGTTGYQAGGGQYATGGGGSTSYNFIGQMHSNNRFLDDNLELDVRVFYELYGNGQSDEWYKTTRGGLSTPGMWSFGNTYETMTTEDYTLNLKDRSEMTIGVGGAVNLSWKDQINLEVTARNDWLSSLVYPAYMPTGMNNYSVFYPSVNAAWVFSDTFQIPTNILSYGKLRASWAQVGSGTKAYETAAGAGTFIVTSETGATNGNLFAATPNIGTLPNYDLKPEIQTSIEVGADVRFLDGRIGLDVAYYKINTKNQIMRLAAVKESGVTTRLINAGNIQNQGWEVQLDFTPIRTNTVRWDIGINGTRNRGKVKELLPDVKEYALWNGGNGGVPGIYAFEGGAYGQIVSGFGYGYTDSGAGVRALYRDYDAVNDVVRDNPNNGKPLLRVTGLMMAGDETSRYFSYVSARTVNTNYYHKAGEKSYNTPTSQEYLYDALGNVEPDLLAGFTTNVSVQIPNAGSVDFFAQLDGRFGGEMISSRIREAMREGNIELSMYGRDAAHGGELRTNYKGEQVYNGLVLDGVFDVSGSKVNSLLTGAEVDLAGMTMRQAVDAGHIAPMFAPYHYMSDNYGFWGQQNINVSKVSYLALREITVGYNFPERWIKHVGLQSARLSFSGRNLCYLHNGLTGKINPESMSSNNPLAPVDYGGVAYTRNFSVNLNLRF